jgi:N-acetylglucosaminyldiphosphoundecaprenol N-acetyl-beta-D-mannosaminyltransferase
MYLRYGDVSWEVGEKPTVAAVPPIAVSVAPPLPREPKTHRSSLPIVTLHGVDLHAITEQTCVDYILDHLDAGQGGVVVTPNLDHLYRCVNDVSFGALVAEADLVVADGMPLVWASRVQGTPLPARVAGSDLIWSLSSAAAKRGRTIFMLGGMPGTAEAAAKILTERNPELKVVGTHCPPVGFEKSDREVALIVDALTAVKPDIIFVALGSPKQEQLIDRIRRTLPSSWWLGVGISFSFVCGDVRRAPGWMQKTGLEWVHRLIQEPRRLFKRYVVVGVPFASRLLARAAMNRVFGNRVRRPGILSRRFTSMAPASSNGKASSNGHPPKVSTLDPVTGETQAAALRTPEQSASVVTRVDVTSTAKTLHRLRALVLLGGSVRQTPLTQSIGRSLLDLPLDEGGSVLNHWLAHADELSRYAGLSGLPVRVLVNRNSPEPTSTSARYAGMVRVERDLSEYRGTGGVLHDLAADFDDDDLILVANAAQVLLDPLSVIAAALDHKRGDVSLISHQDGTPSGVMLVRCKTLRTIPASGFCDMKEQALPLIASSYDVKVMHCRRPSGLPIRSLGAYINALRHYHRRKIGKLTSNDPLAEDWQPAFAIVEDGAIVDAKAHVHDSVVLKGGVVESGAALVRSIVCPGGVAKQKSTVVDDFVCKRV